METLTTHVLMVDDDPQMRDAVCDYLGRNDIRVTAVGTGRQMREILGRDAIDVVLLDVGLPEEDGLSLASRLRETSKVPIVMVTGHMEEADRVLGLELGADDYISKPFSLRELLARIRSVLRRSQFATTVPARDQTLRAYLFAGWELNVRLHRLRSPHGEKVDITNGEFTLLAALLSAPRRVLSRDQLLEMSRLHSIEVYDRSIDVQILRLRRKLEVDPASPQLIKTERGAGYMFDAPVKVLR